MRTEKEKRNAAFMKSLSRVALLKRSRNCALKDLMSYKNSLFFLVSYI